MAKWGNVKYEELKKLKSNLDKMVEETNEEFVEKMAHELANRMLRAVKKKTPVGEYSDLVEFTTREGKHVSFDITQEKVGGTLRRGWQSGNVRKKQGNIFVIEVFNNVFYADYVESGHRVVSKGQTAGFVPGKFMMKISAEDIERLAPQIIEKRLKEYLYRGLRQ